MARTKAPGAAAYVPPGADLGHLREAANRCRGCGLYKDATQAVFGEGDPGARTMLLGEMPGDREDREGEPFVGPAGRVLAEAMDEAGIDRARSYVTNVVKHFKFTRAEGGKRRIHQTPNQTEILACRPWLLAELELLQPQIVICLGATAAKAVFGQSFRITRQRGKLLRAPDLEGVPWRAGEGPWAVATVHPSAVLRSDDRAEMYDGLVADMRVAADAGA